jgi:DNA-binding MarR family transcriptional regulator
LSAAARAESQGDTALSDVVQEFVNRISHAQGKTLAVLTDASVTLQQLLMLRRLARVKDSALSPLAEQMHVSLAAMSQMVERLFQLGLVSRVESVDDRRKKSIAVTPKGRVLLKRITAARSADYAAGIAPLSPRVKAALQQVLEAAIEEL